MPAAAVQPGTYLQGNGRDPGCAGHDRTDPVGSGPAHDPGGIDTGDDTMNIDQDTLDILISKHLDNEITPIEAKLFQDTLDTDPDAQAYFEQIRRLDQANRTAVAAAVGCEPFARRNGQGSASCRRLGAVGYVPRARRRVGGRADAGAFGEWASPCRAIWAGIG